MEAQKVQRSDDGDGAVRVLGLSSVGCELARFCLF